MTGSLTNADVARLLADPSADARADLAERLGQDLSGGALAAGELAIAQDIVRRLAGDVESAVRAALSRSLRHAAQLPRDVALRLADDVEIVALPILTDSLVLTDEDLVDLVRRGTPGKQMAIARRPAVSAPVADALIAHAAEPAVATLMGNPAARIEEPGLNRAIERFPHSAAVTEAMARRAVLPMTVAERLAVLVSARLRDHLVRHHALPPSLAADIVLRGRESAIIRLSTGADEPALLRMVAQMHHGGRLTPSLVTRALCTGDIGFFEAAMAVMAGVPVENARQLIHDAGGNGLVSLLRKTAMPPALSAMIRAAVAVVDQTGFDGGPHDLERYRARVITRVLTQTEAADPADADYLVEKLGDILTEAA